MPTETVVLPDGMMLCRVGRNPCHNGLHAAHVAVNKNKTAARLDITGGPSCYVCFTLAARREGVSFLDLHWPKEQGSATRPAYSYVRATDKDLVLFEISILPNQSSYLAMDAPPDLFVYTAGSLPSVQRLPPCIKDKERKLLMDSHTTGILRLPGDCYIVADLNVYPQDVGMWGELCIFYSIGKKWKIIPNMSALLPQDQSNGGLLPYLWSTDNVLAYDCRFLCWIDYFSGVLLCDFSNSQALRFVPFPGEKEYHDEVRVERCFPERFRSVSISQGKMCFVDIDNHFHDRLHNGWQQPPQKITIWTLSSKFEWELHHVINLGSLWDQPAYPLLHQRLPEFPIISTEDLNVLCCMLTEKEFGGKGWMIMVDNQACLQSCTPESEFVGAEDCDDEFPTIPLLPTVFCRYLERPTGVTWDNDKVATCHSKKHKAANLCSKNHELCNLTWDNDKVATCHSKKHKAANLRSKNHKLCKV